MAVKKVTPAAVSRRIAPPKPPLVPSRTGQMTQPLPKGMYRPTAGQTVGDITKRYGTTASQLAALNPGYKMSAGFGAKANPLRVRSYAPGKSAAPVKKIIPPATSPPAATVAPDAPPDINQWLGSDLAYQDYASMAGKNQSDFLSSLTSRRGNEATTRDQALRNLAEQNPKNREALQEEYASRGLTESGIYGNALTDLSNQYAKSQTDVGSTYTKSMADLTEEEQGYNAEAAAQLSAARQAAIRRRAAKYGLEE